MVLVALEDGGSGYPPPPYSSRKVFNLDGISLDLGSKVYIRKELRVKYSILWAYSSLALCFAPGAASRLIAPELSHGSIVAGPDRGLRHGIWDGRDGTILCFHFARRWRGGRLPHRSADDAGAAGRNSRGDQAACFTRRAWKGWTSEAPSDPVSLNTSAEGLTSERPFNPRLDSSVRASSPKFCLPRQVVVPEMRWLRVHRRAPDTHSGLWPAVRGRSECAT